MNKFTKVSFCYSCIMQCSSFFMYFNMVVYYLLYYLGLTWCAVKPISIRPQTLINKIDRLNVFTMHSTLIWEHSWFQLFILFFCLLLFGAAHVGLGSRRPSKPERGPRVLQHPARAGRRGGVLVQDHRAAAREANKSHGHGGQSSQ